MNTSAAQTSTRWAQAQGQGNQGAIPVDMLDDPQENTQNSRKEERERHGEKRAPMIVCSLTTTIYLAFGHLDYGTCQRFA